MKLAWIKFHGSYGDELFSIGKNGTVDLFIEHYSTEPFCGYSQLRIKTSDNVEMVRQLNGVNYDFAQRL